MIITEPGVAGSSGRPAVGMTAIARELERQLAEARARAMRADSAVSVLQQAGAEPVSVVEARAREALSDPNLPAEARQVRTDTRIGTRALVSMGKGGHTFNAVSHAAKDKERCTFNAVS